MAVVRMCDRCLQILGANARPLLNMEDNKCSLSEHPQESMASRLDHLDWVAAWIDLGSPFPGVGRLAEGMSAVTAHRDWLRAECERMAAAVWPDVFAVV